MRALFLDDATDSALSSLMATHPPIGSRVEALVKFAGGRDPGPIARIAGRRSETPPWAQQDASDATVQIAPGVAPAPWWQGPAQGAPPAPGAPQNSPWGPRG